MKPPASIRVDDVSRSYVTPGGRITALESISLEVPAGSILAVAGPSGCGKSTLLALMGGLDTPDAGRVVVGGHELSRLSGGRRAALRRDFGFVFQVDNLLPFLTVLENVSFQVALAGSVDGEKRSHDLLDRLGIADQAAKLPDQLSGGQRQRVAVARALVHRPSVILADEPTGALDTANSRAVIDVLLAANDELDATLVVVTHDQRMAGRLGRTVTLNNGHIVVEDAADAV